MHLSAGPFLICHRGIRKWWQALPPNKKELFKDSVKKNKWRLLLGLSAFGLLFVVFYFTHLEVSPVTGRSKLLLVGKEHFRLLSDLEYEAVSRKAVRHCTAQGSTPSGRLPQIRKMHCFCF